MSRLSLTFSFAAIFCLGGAAGWLLHDAQKGRAASPAPAAPANHGKPPAPAKVAFKAGMRTDGGQTKTLFVPEITAGLLAALQEGTLKAEFRGNGRDRLRITATNRTEKALRLSIPAGQSFESANGVVVLPHPRTIDFSPGETRLETLSTLAVASGSRIEEITFVASAASQPRLKELLDYLANHPEVSTPAAQTAALAILENLPANAFAKFTEAGSDLPSQWDTSAFKVDTVDIVQALITLRGIGLPDEQLAITVDPQTKIEAMIDPLAHALAMQYYGITPENEWAYWKHELLEGDPSTRHYALHGIARYFPDVALPMLPRWIREPRTNKVFRLVAIQALAETSRADALPILKGLEHELGPESELGKAAREAARYLEGKLDKPAPEAPPVLFRVNKIPAES